MKSAAHELAPRGMGRRRLYPDDFPEEDDAYSDTMKFENYNYNYDMDDFNDLDEFDDETY